MQLQIQEINIKRSPVIAAQQEKPCYFDLKYLQVIHRFYGSSRVCQCGRLIISDPKPKHRSGVTFTRRHFNN